ncbi:MAG TPA: gliding motility-associated C-terminal domain-containing protein, partial [Bacteroidia bacterium]|nr:gliding motility-associated C-terminal domain-containing protein [Bacteroidia bacterium]
RTRTITNQSGPNVALDSVRAVACNGGLTGGVYITPSGGTLPYTYLWSNAATIQDITNVAAGTYTVTVSDANLCTATVSGIVTQPTALNATVTITNATCGLSNGSVIANPTGGTSPFTYLWNTGQTTQTISSLLSGVYTVTVTDANLCTFQRTANVGNSGGPVATVDSIVNVKCNGQSNGGIYISVTGGTLPYTYNWSNGSTTQDISSLTAGAYTVTINDFSGCQTILDTLVTQPAVLNETVSVTPSTCGLPTGSATVTPNGGTAPYTYLWNTGQTTGTITSLTPATYTVTISDANSCSKLRSVTVTNSGGVNIVTDSVRNVKCFGLATGAIYISITSGTLPYLYSWSSGSNSQDLINVLAGSYTVTVTDDNGCSASQSFNINQPATALNDSVHVVNPSCGLLNGSVSSYAYGGTSPYTYQWSSGQTTQVISPLSAGTYTVTIKDANLCSRSRTNVLVAQGSPIAFFDSVKQVTCNGLLNGAIYITVAGGASPITYAWNSGQTTQDLTGLGVGNYTVTVTDVNGCTATLDTSISQPANLSAATQLTNAHCGLANGGINVNPAGGTPPYTYLWSTGQTIQNITSLTAGTYTVTVTDANLCSRVRTVTLTNTPGPSAVIDSVKNVICNGAATGAIYITPSGGTAPITYAWSNGATVQDLVNVTAGPYTVTVSDANLCTVNLTTTIAQPSAVNDSITVINANCGAPTGSATVFPYGGNAPYTLLWNTGQTTATIFSLAAGSYTVTITDFTGCTHIGNANVSNNGAPVISLDSIKNVKCFGGSTGGIYISVSGGLNPYNYNWSNGATTQDLVNVPVGSYTVTITDANSCVSIISGNVTQPPVLQDSTAVTNPTCGSANGIVTVFPYGGTGPYTYQWNTGQTTQSVNALIANTYTVTVRDFNNCTVSAMATFVNQGGPAATLDSVKNIKCFGAATGAVYISVTGGTNPITYLWSSGSTTEDILNVIAGNYTVTVTDGNSCTSVLSATVNQPTQLNDSLHTVPEACGNMNGSITLFAYGGTVPYSYQWNTGQTTSAISSLISGNYTVTISDGNGCTKIQSASVGASGSPAIALDSIRSVSCNGGSNGGIFISISGGQTPYTYQWTGGATTQNISNVAAGAYTVIVSDLYLCRDTATFTITQPAVLNDSTHVTATTCALNNGSITAYPFGGTGPYNYLWSGGQSSQTISGLAAGNYTVTITDAHSCIKVSTALVTAIPKPVITLDSIVDVTCNGGFNGAIYISVTLGTTPYSYNWSTFDITQDLINVAAGNYTVTVTDGSNCAVSQTFTVGQPTAIGDSVHVNNATCGTSNGSATVYPFGGIGPYTFNWNTGATTQTIVGLNSGFYAVTITDNHGCSYTESVSVSNLGGPQMQVDSIVAVLCNGGNNGGIYLTTLNGTSPFTYAWSNGASTEDISGLTAGIYSLTVTDANLCLFVNSYTITEPDAITDSANVQNATCGLMNGAITVFPIGGTPPYFYAWNTGATSQSVTGLAAGNYTVTISDGNNCSLLVPFQIISLPGPSITLDSITNILCFGDSSGAVYITAGGGTNPLSYLWSDNSTTEDISGLPFGVYTVTVTDLNGCTAVQQATVTEPPQITAQFNITQTTCNTANGSIDAVVTGGNPGYNYLWSNGSTTANITGLLAGSYTLTVEDQNGCSVSFVANVGNISAPVISVVDSGNVTCAGLSNGFILVNVSSGTPPYNYSWSNTSQTGNFISGLAGNTTYTLTLTDSIGCIAIRSVFISAPAPIAINASIPQLNGTYQISCFGGDDASISLDVTGGTAPYTYLWSTLAATDSIGSLTAGTYTVTVTDLNSCTATGSYVINEPPELVSSAGQNNVICGINSDTLHANTPSYGTGSWSVLSGSGTFFNVFQPNTVVTGLSQGVNVFQWIVSDGVCSTVSQVVITFNNQVQALAGSDRSICTDSVVLTATNPQFGYGYWQVFSSTGIILDTTSAATLVTLLNPGANVFVWNVINGTCNDSDLVSIFVKDPSDCNEDLEFPTGITPNNDGYNDYFEIRGLDAYPDNVLVVYNRWGNKVYEKDSYDNSWQGTNNSGNPLPEGTYFYIFKVRNPDKSYTNYVDIRR